MRRRPQNRNMKTLENNNYVMRRRPQNRNIKTLENNNYVKRDDGLSKVGGKVEADNNLKEKWKQKIIEIKNDNHI